MNDQLKKPARNVVPGVVSVTYRSNVSLYEAVELWITCGLKPLKDGITYSRNFPPAVVQCDLAVPVGQESDCAERIKKHFGTLVKEAKTIPKPLHPEGPFGC